MLVHWHHSNELERHSLERMYLPPTKLFPRLAVNKTILKPRVTAATGGQYVSRNKIPHCSTHTISEKAIRFRHPDHNPDQAQNLISSSMSRHLSTRNISSKCITRFWVILLTDRQTDKRGQTHLPPPRVARWLSGRASDLRSSSRGFEPRPRRCCVTTLGKLFTPYCLCHQAV